MGLSGPGVTFNPSTAYDEFRRENRGEWGTCLCMPSKMANLEDSRRLVIPVRLRVHRAASTIAKASDVIFEFDIIVEAPARCRTWLRACSERGEADGSETLQPSEL